MEKAALLEVKNLKKIYTTRFGGNQVQALSDINFSVEEGEYVAIMGESGSGKTTLLNILAALDKPTSGTVLLNGKNIVSINGKEIAAFRRDNLGFIFQDFNLLDNFSLKDNILLPLVLEQVPPEEMEPRLMPVAKKLGIHDILQKYPYEVSGGQKQRAAAARALITKPQLILGDEPTGSVILVQHYPKQIPVMFPSLSTFISSMTDRQRVRFSSRVKVSYIALKSAVKIFLMAAKSGGASCAGSGSCPSAAVYIS